MFRFDRIKTAGEVPLSMIDVLLIILGCVCLYVGATALIRGATALGQKLSLPPTLIGLLLVALGTSTPEIAVSVGAALQGHGAIAAGNVVGSNIINIALVLGTAAVVRRLPADDSLYYRDLPALVGLTFLAVIWLGDGFVSRTEGLVLFAAVLAYLLYTLSVGRGHYALQPESGTTPSSALRAIGQTVVGVTLLVFGADWLVAGGVGLARAFNVAESTIALTVTAVGTGIPEIAATFVAVARGHYALGLGNIVGSNLMNLGFALGIAALVAPFSTVGLGWFVLTMLVILTLAIWVIVMIQRMVNRWVGVALLMAFGFYQVGLLQ